MYSLNSHCPFNIYFLINVFFIQAHSPLATSIIQLLMSPNGIKWTKWVWREWIGQIPGDQSEFCQVGFINVLLEDKMLWSWFELMITNIFILYILHLLASVCIICYWSSKIYTSYRRTFDDIICTSVSAGASLYNAMCPREDYVIVTSCPFYQVNFDPKLCL